jgi:hypothetical protein
MRLYVSAGTAEDVGHFSLSSREVVRIDFELVLQLKLLIVKCRVGSVCKQRGVRDLCGPR